MKKWNIISYPRKPTVGKLTIELIVHTLLHNRGIKNIASEQLFFSPKDACALMCKDVGIRKRALDDATKRIEKAISQKESIVVYADYDADGVTAGAIMWETLYGLGANVMPYIPHRVEEGYGLSEKGIDYVAETYHPKLIITVDHGITGKERIAYAKKKGIECIVTDHHVKPSELPDCTIIHTTQLSGAGISWFVANYILSSFHDPRPTPALSVVEGTQDLRPKIYDLLGLAAVGTIADMVSLTGANRSIAKYGLEALKQSKRPGLLALMKDAGVTQDMISSNTISHILAPRINAMGRMEHALDSLRLLCTTDSKRAELLAGKLGSINRDRQQLTFDTALHAHDIVSGGISGKKILVVSHETYNQGIIGLVAGKLVETYYLPSVVIAKGEMYSKASARSIPGFNIIEAVRKLSDILVDAGGHPMAAGFTIETKHIDRFIKRLEKIADELLTDEMLVRQLFVDMELPLDAVTEELWQEIRKFEPFGLGNYEPVFASKNVAICDIRLIGNGNKHLKLKIKQNKTNDLRPTTQELIFDAIAFGMGDLYSSLKPGQSVDIAYTVDMNEWNGNRKLQLKIKDINLCQN